MRRRTNSMMRMVMRMMLSTAMVMMMVMIVAVTYMMSMATMRMKSSPISRVMRRWIVTRTCGRRGINMTVAATTTSMYL